MRERYLLKAHHEEQEQTGAVSAKSVRRSDPGGDPEGKSKPEDGHHQEKSDAQAGGGDEE